MDGNQTIVILSNEINKIVIRNQRIAFLQAVLSTFFWSHQARVFLFRPHQNNNLKMPAYLAQTCAINHYGLWESKHWLWLKPAILLFIKCIKKWTCSNCSNICNQFRQQWRSREKGKANNQIKTSQKIWRIRSFLNSMYVIRRARMKERKGMKTSSRIF